MIRAASISYAVFMAVLTGLFCYGMVLVFSLNTNLEDHYEAASDLVQDRFSALAYAKSEFYEFEPGQIVEGPGLRSDIQHRFKKQPWGLFWNLSVQSIRHKDSLNLNYLVAPQMEESDPTLHLRDNDDPLKLSGETTLEGLVKCSGQNIKRVRITSDTKMDIVQNGAVQSAAKRLPKIALPDFDLTVFEQPVIIENAAEPVFQAFNKEVGIFNASGLLEDLSLSGQIVIQSQDTLTIAASAILNDVIVRAPKVILKEGFKGRLQIIATQAIELEDQVTLQYPSALIIEEDTNGKSSIIVGEDCAISGAVVLTGGPLNEEPQHLLKIGLNSEVQGQIYCGGTLELYGNVNGQITASALLYQTNTTKHTNLLKDVSLKKPEHPEWLFGLDWQDEFKAPVILKKV